MPFRYLKDPLFLTCFTAYWLHRMARQWNCSTPLSEAYLNDVVCVGFWVPIVLWAHRKLGLRTHDNAPAGFEIVIPAIAWALVFEVLLPASPWWSRYAVPDPNDVCCYFVGGLAAMLFWQWYCGCAFEPRQGVAKGEARFDSQDRKAQ